MTKPGIPTIPTGLLRDIGEALYGPNWIAPLAKALGINKDTVRAAAEGRRYLPTRMLNELLALAETRLNEIEAAKAKVLAFRPTGEPS